MNKFEYKTLVYETSGWYAAKIDTAHFDVKLNELAKEGWELDKCFPLTESYGKTRDIIFIFKREVN